MIAYTRNKSDTHTGSMSFNMFRPAPEISSAKREIIHESSVMRCTVEHLLEIKKRSKEVDSSVVVSSDAVVMDRGITLTA